MNIVTPEFKDLVERLMGDLKPGDCIDPEEYRFARELNALPLGVSLWSYGFLRPDGEIILTGWEPEEISRSRSLSDLIRSVVIAADRYPQFIAFIPGEPDEAVICPACQGTRIWGRKINTDEPARCVICAGLGWTTPDA